MVYGVKVSTLIGTEGDAALNAALNNLGMWKDDMAVVVPLSDEARDDLGFAIPKDVRRGTGRRSGARISMVKRIRTLFPHMTTTQAIAMARNIDEASS